MDVSDVLASAWAQVEKAGLPPALQEVAFREAVQLLAGGVEQVAARKPGVSGGQSGQSATSPDPKKAKPKPVKKSAPSAVNDQDSLPRIDEKEFFEKLHEETGVDTEKLEQVYYVDAGIPRIGLKPAQLGDNLKDRMVTISKLICVARAVGCGEEATSMRIIRTECRRLRSIDDKNINKYLSEIDGVAYVGPQRDRSLKVRPAAERAFPAFIDKILNGKADSRVEQS